MRVTKTSVFCGMLCMGVWTVCGLGQAASQGTGAAGQAQQRPTYVEDGGMNEVL